MINFSTTIYLAMTVTRLVYSMTDIEPEKYSARFESDLRYHSFCWDLIDKIGFSGNLPLQRICSLMRKSNAKSYLLEELDENSDEDFLQEKKELDDLSGIKGSLRIQRLSFFSSSRITENSDQELECLCSAVLFDYKNKNIISGECQYVYEAILSHPHKYNICMKKREEAYLCRTWLLNNYIHTSKEFEVNINCDFVDQKTNEEDYINKIFKIRGTYFCEQNKITSSCGHSSLKMVVNSMCFSPEDFELGKLTTTKINNLISAGDKKKRTAEA